MVIVQKENSRWKKKWSPQYPPFSFRDSGLNSNSILVISVSLKSLQFLGMCTNHFPEFWLLRVYRPHIFEIAYQVASSPEQFFTTFTLFFPPYKLWCWACLMVYINSDRMISCTCPGEACVVTLKNLVTSLHETESIYHAFKWLIMHGIRTIMRMQF